MYEARDAADAVISVLGSRGYKCDGNLRAVPEKANIYEVGSECGCTTDVRVYFGRDDRMLVVIPTNSALAEKVHLRKIKTRVAREIQSKLPKLAAVFLLFPEEKVPRCLENVLSGLL